MRISYDEEVDAMYIELIEGERECRVVQLTDDISLNMGVGEVLVGIEILNAREVLGGGKLPKVVVDNLPVRAA